MNNFGFAGILKSIFCHVDQANPVFLKVWSDGVNDTDSKVPPHIPAG